MQASETAQPTTAERCEPSEHDWQIVGKCTHGFGGRIFFAAAKCAKCGQGGHRQTRAMGCPRRSEKPAERAARIERQIAACPVWDAMPADWQDKLRG